MKIYTLSTEVFLQQKRVHQVDKKVKVLAQEMNSSCTFGKCGLLIVHISLLWAAGHMLDTGIIEPSKRELALCAKQWGYLSMRWWGYLTILLMVRGLFTHLKFPCAQFLCTGLAGIINCINYFAVTTLYSITFDRRPTIWSFVGGCVLPWKYGLQGFGVLWWYWANRRLFSLHESGVDCSHFMSQGQQLYTKSSTHMLSTVKSATSDPLHLIKTMKN